MSLSLSIDLFIDYYYFFVAYLSKIFELSLRVGRCMFRKVSSGRKSNENPLLVYKGDIPLVLGTIMSIHCCC